jgi:hypothetical protein
LRQGRHLHIAYWTDPQLAEAVAEEISSRHAAAAPTVATAAAAELSPTRFRYGTLKSTLGFHLLSLSVIVLGAVLLALVQAVGVPRLEKEHRDTWQARLEADGTTVVGQLCPQRELDTTGEYPGFERAVAGISFTTPEGRLSLEAYARSRPDIDWDEVQMAVFGRLPHSPLLAGLRHMLFMDDPLLEVRECQDVRVRYARSDPRIFSLPERFHRSSAGGILTRIGRILLLLFVWLMWWGLVYSVMGAALGVHTFAGRDADAPP